eukprot:m.188969 g.188969  ORF g.188969 m.188969 type:complete len:135 (+) comp39398_c0_seq11:781-1185(+)
MPIDELLVLNPKMASVNVWMGQPGVIAHCHYDGYHNFYTQLFGRKRFTLFRPLQWRHLYPYPYLHPSHAQCQVNLSDPNMEQFPAVENAESVEVISCTCLPFGFIMWSQLTSVYLSMCGRTQFSHWLCREFTRQ